MKKVFACEGYFSGIKPGEYDVTAYGSMQMMVGNILPYGGYLPGEIIEHEEKYTLVVVPKEYFEHGNGD